MLDIRDTDRIRIITLNRPDALNAFNEALYDATTEALMAAADDPTVAVVVITGTGRAFSAGTDVIEMSQRNSGNIEPGRYGFPGLIDQLAAFPKPLHQRGERSGPRHRHDDVGAVRPRVHVHRRPAASARSPRWPSRPRPRAASPSRCCSAATTRRGP